MSQSAAIEDIEATPARSSYASKKCRFVFVEASLRLGGVDGGVWNLVLRVVGAIFALQ